MRHSARDNKDFQDPNVSTGLIALEKEHHLIFDDESDILSVEFSTLSEGFPMVFSKSNTSFMEDRFNDTQYSNDRQRSCAITSFFLDNLNRAAYLGYRGTLAVIGDSFSSDHAQITDSCAAAEPFSYDVKITSALLKVAAGQPITGGYPISHPPLADLALTMCMPSTVPRPVVTGFDSTVLSSATPLSEIVWVLPMNRFTSTFALSVTTNSSTKTQRRLKRHRQLDQTAHSLNRYILLELES